MTDLQEKLLAWFAACSRDLPWRRAYLPYHIWISEVMLQQTQMARAVEYFNRWCDTLPDIASVSAADEQTVFKLWEGLGYYSRARNILKTAQILVRDFEGRLPDAYRALRQLPGIGDYTAGAIMSLAFNQDYPAVDANVERVLARLFDIDTPVKERKTRLLIHRSATELIPTGQARNLNQALMELGALVCRAEAPRCWWARFRTCTRSGIVVSIDRATNRAPAPRAASRSMPPPTRRDGTASRQTSACASRPSRRPMRSPIDALPRGPLTAIRPHQKPGPLKPRWPLGSCLITLRQISSPRSCFEA